MANEKRSFFERLTGAVKLDEESNQAPAPQSLRPAYNALYNEEEEEGQLTVDVYQTTTEIVIKTMVAGVKPDDLDVNITRDSVTIRGKRQEDRTVAEENYFHHE